jgi:hypothetical protein
MGCVTPQIDASIELLVIQTFMIRNRMLAAHRVIRPSNRIAPRQKAASDGGLVVTGDAHRFKKWHGEAIVAIRPAWRGVSCLRHPAPWAGHPCDGDGGAHHRGD